MADSKLTPKLSNLLAWCQRNPGRRRQDALPGGLVIRVYLDHQGLRHVLLLRQAPGPTGKGPSDQECRTVLAHWPEPVPAGVQWTAFSREPWKCCVAVWRQAEQLQMDMGHGQQS